VTAIAGLVIGVLLGALGGGGSILAVPALVYLGGLTFTEATAISLVAVGVSAVVSSVSHARRGNVRVGVAAAFVAAGAVASWAGKEVHTHLDDDLLMLLFSGLILVAAHRMLTACPSCTRAGEEAAGESVVDGSISVGWLLVAGMGVGFLTGLFGVGGGFVIVPVLTLALGFNMAKAIGTSLLIVAGNSLVALLIRGFDTVEWDLAMPFVIAMLIGSVVGARIAPKLPPTASLRAFASVLVAVAIANGAASAIALAR